MIVVSDILIRYFESFVDYLVNTRKTSVVEEEHYTNVGPSASDETAGTLFASVRKIGFQNTERCSTIQQEINCNVTGYRLIDMELLGEIFHQMPCKEF